MLTNTHSIGAVHEGTIAWRVKQGDPDATGYWWSNPTVGETWDGELNDINGFHVKQANVFEALDSARGGPVVEGNVGGGTGHDLQRLQGRHRDLVAPRSAEAAGGYTVGVLVQCNCGRKPDLLDRGRSGRRRDRGHGRPRRGLGLDPHRRRDRRAAGRPQQLKRLARRASLGLARTGSRSGNGSGDLFLAFSTANPGRREADRHRLGRRCCRTTG